MNSNERKETKMRRTAIGVMVGAMLAGCGGQPPEDAVETKTGALASWECAPGQNPALAPFYSPCWRGLAQCMAPNYTGTYLQPIQDMQMGSEGIMLEPNRVWITLPPPRGLILAVQDHTQPGQPVSRTQWYANDWAHDMSVSMQNWGSIEIKQGRTTGSCGNANNQFSMSCKRIDNGSTLIPVSYTATTGFSGGTLLVPPAGPIADPGQFEGAQGYWKTTVDMTCHAFAYTGPVGMWIARQSSWQAYDFTVPAGRIKWFETAEIGVSCFSPTGTSLDHTHVNAQLQNITNIPATDPVDILEFSASYTMNCTP